MLCAARDLSFKESEDDAVCENSRSRPDNSSCQTASRLDSSKNIYYGINGIITHITHLNNFKRKCKKSPYLFKYLFTFIIVNKHESKQKKILANIAETISRYPNVRIKNCKKQFGIRNCVLNNETKQPVPTKTRTIIIKGSRKREPFTYIRCSSIGGGIGPDREEFCKKAAGKSHIYNDGDYYAYSGIKHTVDRIRNVLIFRRVEHNYVKHDRAGRNGAVYMEYLAYYYHHDNAYEKKERFRYKLRFWEQRRKLLVEVEKQHTGKAAYHSSPKAVAARFHRGGEIGVHGKNRRDAGKGGVAVDKSVYQCAKRSGNGGFKIS